MTAARARPAPASLPAAQVHTWRVGRQLLDATTRVRGKDAPESIARALVGVQAQVMSSAALSIALRTDGGKGAPGAIEATTAAVNARRLVRSWAMRGTLHLFEAEDYPTIIAAMGGKENWRRPAWLRYFGVTEPQMEGAIEAVGEILDDGRARTRAELADELAAHSGPEVGALVRGSWGTFLKQAAEKGYVCHAAIDGDTAVRFVRPSRWLGWWRTEEHEVALQSVVLRYLAAYGPASQTELRRWWGITQATLFKGIAAELGDAITEIEVAGDRGYIRTEDLAAIRATAPSSDSVQLLGPFDPLIVAAGLREQLIPPAHLKRVSRTAGWISPVVLVDGLVAGVWDAKASSRGLAVTIDAFDSLSAKRRSAIAAAAERVATAQGLVAGVEYGRVFAPPPAVEEA